ncbi:MAG: tRNA (guanine(46)-N(7))-methyltransferase TrmB [bacterium]
MIIKPSRKIISNQNGIHGDLEKILVSHREAPYRKPIAQHTMLAFEQAKSVIARQQAPLILDSGCGTGKSTVFLAQKYPGHFVIGIDKSLARLSKNPSFDPLLGGAGVGQNFLLVRADLIDFWRLAVQHNWQIDKHYLLYPNPWPKKNQIKRRFHGHPVFFDLIKLGRSFELRSNWRIYVQEFAMAFEFATGIRAVVEKFPPNTQFISRFEKKYAESGHDLFKLMIERN